MSEQNLSSTLMRMKAMLPDAVPEGRNNVGTPNSTGIDGGRKTPETQVVTESHMRGHDKVEESIKTLTNNLSTTANSVKTIVKKQDEMSSTNSNLQKKVKELQSSFVTTEHKIQKENNKMGDIDCRLKQIEKQIKKIDKKLEQGGLKSGLIDLLHKELSQMENDILKAVRQALHRVDETESQVKFLANDFEKLKMHMLDLLEVTGYEKTAHSKNALVFEIVKKELSVLTNDVTKAYKDCVTKIEKNYTQNKGEIKQLKNALKSEQKRNNKLESRVTQLENSLKKSSKNEKTKIVQKSQAETKSLKKDEKSKPVSQSKKESIKKQTENVQKSELTRKERRRINKENENASKMESSRASLCPAEEKPSTHHEKASVTIPKTNSSDSSLSYFEKAQLYLLSQLEGNLQASEEIAAMNEKSNYFAATVINKDSIITEPVLQGSPIEWAIRKKRDSTMVESIQHGSIIYTKTPGYRIQFRAQLDQLHGDIYFSIRVLKGVFDDQLTWPFVGQFKIRVLHKSSKSNKQSEIWMLPSASNGLWEEEMLKPAGRKSRVYSEWVGPFDISHYLERDLFYLLIELV